MALTNQNPINFDNQYYQMPQSGMENPFQSYSAMPGNFQEDLKNAVSSAIKENSGDKSTSSAQVPMQMQPEQKVSTQEEYDEFKIQQKINDLQEEFNQLSQKKAELQQSITGIQSKYAPKQGSLDELERKMAANRARRIKKDNESLKEWNWKRELDQKNDQFNTKLAQDNAQFNTKLNQDDAHWKGDTELKREQIKAQSEDRKETSRRTLTSSVTDQLSKIQSNIEFYKAKAAIGTTAEKQIANAEIQRLEMQRDSLINKAKANGIEAADFWNFQQPENPNPTPVVDEPESSKWPKNVWDPAYDAETFGMTGADEEAVKKGRKERENQTNAAIVKFMNKENLPEELTKTGFKVESKTYKVDNKNKPLKSSGYAKKTVTSYTLKDPTGKVLKVRY